MALLRSTRRRRAVESDADPAALIRIFSGIAERWGLNVQEQCALLGDVSRSTHHNWTHGRPPERFTTDQLHRIAHVVGVDVAAQAFYGVGSENAATHVRRPRTAPNGEGTALAVMLTGLPGLAAVRQHLELLAGGSVVGTLYTPDARAAADRRAPRRSA
jgi:uncharacterized protein (DUF2384 family)